MQAYVWNYGVVDDVSKTDFRAIVTGLLSTWAVNSQRLGQHITSVSSHSTTKELVTLTDNFIVSCFTLEEENPVLTELCLLNRNSSVISEQDQLCHSFCLGLFLGLVWKSGLISLYSIQSGMLLCVIEELRGQNVNVWRSCADIPSVGVWSCKGIWKLQSKTIVDISDVIKSESPKGAAHMVSFVKVKCQEKGQPPVENFDQSYVPESGYTMSDSTTPQFDTLLTTVPQVNCPPNQVADGSPQTAGKSTGTTPATDEESHSNEASFTAPCHAVDFLVAWNLNQWATKLSLALITSHKIFLNIPERDFKVPEMLLNRLTSESIQGPALVLALFWDHPFLRAFIVQQIQEYLEANIGKVEDVTKARPKTVLHDVMLPYLREFLVLSKKYDSIIQNRLTESCITPSEIATTGKPARQEAMEILASSCIAPLDCSLLTRLEILVYQCQKEVLQSVAEFLAIDVTEEEAHVEVTREKWRQIFR